MPPTSFYKQQHRFPYQLLLILLLITHTYKTTAQLQNEPRYNRFQWHNYTWHTFHTKAFHIYFPKGNDSMASYISRELPEATKKIKRSMGTSLLRPPHVILYPSVTQVYESNIGLYETKEYSFPTFITKGTRLVLAYTDNYEQLKAQLYEALARSIWEAQLRQNLEEQAKSKTGEEDIPYWYKEGAIKYFANGWPIQAEDQLKRSFREQRFTNWQQSIAYQPKLSGQAFCYFLQQQYYPQAPMQLFSQLKKKKNLRRALRLITKKNIDSVLYECHQYYTKRFIEKDTTKQITKSKSTNIPKATGILKNLQTSEDGKQIAYATYSKNKRTTWLYDTKTKEQEKISSYILPPWINDYSSDPYPLLQWESNNLYITQPKKNKFSILNPTQGTQTSIARADGITKTRVTSNKQYQLSAYKKGQSDIVTYDPNKEAYTALTNDPYDDNSFDLNQQGATVFTSDRKIQEATPEQKRTIGFKDTSETEQGIYLLNNKKVQPIQTDIISYSKWDKPIWLSSNQILATHTKQGTENFAIINNFNQHNGAIQTLGNYQPIQYHPQTNSITSYTHTKDTITIYTTPLQEWIADNNNIDTTSPWLTDYNNNLVAKKREDSLIKVSKDDNPSFLEGVLIPKGAKEKTRQREDSIAKSLQYDTKKVKPYILQLHGAYFSAKVNNDYFINRYQPYQNYQGQFKFPELGGMAQGGFTDIFENHHVNIGFRLPAGSEGSDFYIRYENTKKRIDWGVAYFRKVESLNADPKRNWTDEAGRLYPNNAKVKTHYGEVNITHPFTYYLKAGFIQAIRYDRTIFLATDKYTLKFEDYRSVWSISTLSVTYNKLQPTIPMLHKGYHAKAMIDVFQPLGGNEGTVTGNTIQLQYHQPIYKYITWVSKFQIGYSGRQSKVLYNLGGIDNNVTVRVDSNAQAPQNVPYAFQTLVTPLRGYLQNTIQGNQYLNWNNDVYFPVFQTLIPIETLLNFINNLQLGIFSDIATARETWNPTNPINNKWHLSYGLSARTTLAGYPIRVDMAWPGTFSKQPILYFSLSSK